MEQGEGKSDFGIIQILWYFISVFYVVYPFFSIQFYYNTVNLFCIQVSFVRLQSHTLLLLVVRVMLFDCLFHQG